MPPCISTIFLAIARPNPVLTADNGGQLVRILAEKHIPAQVIGRVNKGIAREMIVQEGRGFLERPQPDEITKVIPDFFK